VSGSDGRDTERAVWLDSGEEKKSWRLADPSEVEVMARSFVGRAILDAGVFTCPAQ